ncbi:MAG TPA: Asp-tRNA(Asn)/Glu-tRNA(Gln) amidotransferase subunit GatC [Candidatus Saccharimonadales bacterium]
MTQISRDDVARLATLSSLQLADEEIDALVSDLDGIVGYITQLDELDTSGVMPTYQVTGLENIWRNDEVQQGVAPEKLIELSSEAVNDQIKVPKVL